MRFLPFLLLGVMVIASGCNNHRNHPTVDAGHLYTMSGNTVTTSPGTALHLAPATDVDVPSFEGDHGPAQIFEVIRPEGTPLKLGRVIMDCSCVQASIMGDKTEYGPDERAFVMVRQGKPATGPSFHLSVQVLKPSQQILMQQVNVEYNG